MFKKKNRLQMYCMSGVMLFILAMARDLFFTWTKNYPFLLLKYIVSVDVSAAKNKKYFFCLLFIIIQSIMQSVMRIYDFSDRKQFVSCSPEGHLSKES